MPIFNQALLIDKAPADIVAMIKASLGEQEQFVTPRPDSLMIALRGQWAYMYVLQLKESGSTEVRLIVDESDTIRDAFRGREIKEAMMLILKSPTHADNGKVAASAGEHLASLKQRAEQSEIAPPAAPILLTSKPLPEEKKRTAADPWNPDSFGFLYLFNSIFAGIAFALNWGRLGKPQWLLPTLGLSLVPLLAVPVMLAPIPASMFWLKMGLLMFTLGAGWGVVLGLNNLQKGAYKHWTEGGDLTTYDYNFDRAAIIGVLVALAFSLFSGGYAYMTTRPTVRETATATITIPSIWAVASTDNMGQCQSPAQFECVLGMSEERFGYTSVIIGKYPASLGLTTSQVAEASRNYMISLGGEILETDTTQIDGLTAQRFVYRIPVDGDNHQGMQVHVGREDGVYEITAESLNQGIYWQRYDDIEDLIAGIDFK